MTTNHEHTPSNEKVTTFFKTLRMMHQTRMVELQHPSDDKDRMDEYGQIFDKFMAARDARIEAAAEQRGAVMVMDTLRREASDPNWEGMVQPGRSLQELVDHIEHDIRADQMEGDDE